MTVARVHFLRDGYAGTSMSAIAAELGGSKGTLWSYFPSKEALFAATLDRATRIFRAELSQILDPCGSLHPTLLRACVSLLGKMASSEAVALHRLIIAEGQRFPELSKIFFDLAPKGTRQLVAEFLKSAMDRGLLRPADPLDAARALMGLILSGTHQDMLMGGVPEPDASQIDREARFVVDLFLRAYAPEPDGHGA